MPSNVIIGHRMKKNWTFAEVKLVCVYGSISMKTYDLVFGSFLLTVVFTSISSRMAGSPSIANAGVIVVAAQGRRRSAQNVRRWTRPERIFMCNSCACLTGIANWDEYLLLPASMDQYWERNQPWRWRRATEKGNWIARALPSSFSRIGGVDD